MNENRNFDLKVLMQWIETNISKFPYSEISLRFCIHDGRIKRIERTLLEKLK